MRNTFGDSRDAVAGAVSYSVMGVLMHESAEVVHSVLASINDAWRANRPAAMRGFLDPGITMVLPGFGQSIVGRDALLASFDDFCQNSSVLEYRESEESIQVVSNCAVASFRFEMVYERSGYRATSGGRDLWVFERKSGAWLAVWRTMLELSESGETANGASD